MKILLIVSLLTFLVSLPFWLPKLLIKLRTFIFTCVNGEESIQIPNKTFDANDFREIYISGNAEGRSKGAGLSDLFWYWLSPGPEMHQEHLEKGPRYEAIAKYTKHLLAVPREEIEALLEKSFDQAFHLNNNKKWHLKRVRDLMMPVFADFYYELVFNEKCPKHVRKLIVDHANDVVTALKCCGLRHMKKRNALTIFLLNKLQDHALARPFPENFTLLEQAYYLQGAFFNTAVVQMSDAMSHIMMVLAKHTDIQQELASNPSNRVLYNHVINETLRLYPLFGIAHRIISKDICTRKGLIKKGSVVCFNYPEYQKIGFEQANRFKPDRWKTCKAQNENYIPFGMKENRPCPAQAASLISIRMITQCILKEYSFSTTAKHTRAQLNRAPVLLTRRNKPKVPTYVLLFYIKIRDQWEDVFRSVAQLVFGTIMIIDARRLKLCQKYFNIS